jgi:hypothetical protein
MPEDKIKNSNGQVEDDAALAEALAGISPTSGGAPSIGGLQFEESPMPVDQPAGAQTPDSQPPVSSSEPQIQQLAPEPLQSQSPQPAPETPSPAVGAVANDSLTSLKQEALADLRPLVDKLVLPANEKFDIMLLIIRGTDDQSLLDPAYQAARAIEDENKRAQALLDVIREIDFFSSQHK